MTAFPDDFFLMTFYTNEQSASLHMAPKDDAWVAAEKMEAKKGIQK